MSDKKEEATRVIHVRGDSDESEESENDLDLNEDDDVGTDDEELDTTGSTTKGSQNVTVEKLGVAPKTETAKPVAQVVDLKTQAKGKEDDDEDAEDEDEDEDAEDAEDDAEAEDDDDEDEDDDDDGVSTTELLSADPLYFVLSRFFNTADGKSVVTVLDEINTKLGKIAKALNRSR